MYGIANKRIIKTKCGKTLNASNSNEANWTPFHFDLCIFTMNCFFCYAIYKIVSKNELDLINANERWIYLMIMLKATLPIELESNHILWRKMRQLEATKNEQWLFDAFIFFPIDAFVLFFFYDWRWKFKIRFNKI